MAEQVTISKPAPYLEAAGEKYLDVAAQLAAKEVPVSTFAPTIAGQGPLAQAAQQTAATQAGLGTLQFNEQGAVTGVGTGTGIAGYQPFLQKAQDYMGPTAYQDFESPYQQEVISATLSEFDKQRQIAQQQIAASAIGAGAFGGGREGVQRAEYGRQRDIYDAGIMSKLRQEGFQQAQQQAQQNLLNQLNLGGKQQQFETAATTSLGGAGTAAQTYSQSILDAIREQNLLGQQFPLSKVGAAANIFANVAGGVPGGAQPPIVTNPALAGIQGFAGLYGGLGGQGGLSSLINTGQ